MEYSIMSYHQICPNMPDVVEFCWPSLISINICTNTIKKMFFSCSQKYKYLLTMGNMGKFRTFTLNFLVEWSNIRAICGKYIVILKQCLYRKNSLLRVYLQNVYSYQFLLCFEFKVITILQNPPPMTS